MERPKLEEKVSESRVMTWTTPSRRPLPPVPDQTGRGISVTEKCWINERTIVKSNPEMTKSGLFKKSIPPLKKAPPFLKAASHKSTSLSSIFPVKFENNRSELEEVMSDPEMLQRGRSTGNALRTEAPRSGSATSGHKTEVQNSDPLVTWSPWSSTSLKRSSEKPRPPVPKKPSVQIAVTQKPSLTSRSSTGTLKELDVGSVLDASKSCLQRPGTLSLGQLDSSGYDEGDYESHYDEIKSPMMMTNQLSCGAEDQPKGTDKDAPQQDDDFDFILFGETLSLRSTDTGSHSCGKSDSENEEHDSSYEEISLPSSRTSSAAETTSDSGVSSAATNVSTPTLNHGVHNFIDLKQDSQSSFSSDDFPDPRQAVKEGVGRTRTPPLPSTKRMWRSADDVPLDIVSLSVEQVSACLVVLKLGQYVRTFREQQIDGALLSCLDKDVLVSDFGFRKFDAIKLAKFARDGWRPKVDQGDATPC